MKIPYVNIAGQFERDKQALMPILEDVLSSGLHVNAPIVNDLEKTIASYHRVAHCICLNSGTDALVFALMALGVGHGDEVITQSNSFVASAAAIIEVGAIPVFVDVLDDQSIDPEKICKCITSKTKAIMPVHLTGRIGDMTVIQKIATDHNLLIVEDAAQSIGSTWQGRLSGTLGNVGCFSAHPLKNLGAVGDAGFLLTNDGEIASYVKLLRNHGLETRDKVTIWGRVSRMDAMQAAVIKYRMEHIDSVIAARVKNAGIYRSLLNPAAVYYPKPRTGSLDSYHTFVVQVDNRDSLQQHLAELGIGTTIHYPIPIHLQPAAKDLDIKTNLVVTENQARRILSLPIHELLAHDEVEYVAQSINAFYGS